MVTRVSNEERKKAVEAFYEKVAEGYPVDRTWMKGMIEASAPSLPEDASAEQLDAWIELAALLDDAGFVQSMRANAADFWTKDVDLGRFEKAKAAAVASARAARGRGVRHTSEEARTIVEALVRETAIASGAKDEAALRARMRLKHDARAERYWDLVAIMKGEARPAGPFDDWRWLSAAMRHHLAV